MRTWISHPWRNSQWKSKADGNKPVTCQDQLAWESPGPVGQTTSVLGRPARPMPRSTGMLRSGCASGYVESTRSGPGCTCASRNSNCGKTTASPALGRRHVTFRGRIHDLVRKPDAENSHVRIDEQGPGNVAMGAGLRTGTKVTGSPNGVVPPDPNVGALVPNSTNKRLLATRSWHKPVTVTAPPSHRTP